MRALILSRMSAALILTVLAAGVAVAQTPARPAPAAPAAPAVQVPQTAPQARLSFAPVVHKVTPAVVNVYATRVQQQPRNAFLEDPIFRRFFGGGGDSAAPRERVQRSLGSGVLVDPAGLVVTNHHVIEGMTEVKVALTDKREFEAEIVLRDPRTDLAILRIKGAEPFAALALGNSDTLEVGDLVLAVGNPFGVGQTVTQGIVSALARTQVGVTDYQFFIQTDAAINPGNSGGALVDIDGRLIGVNTAIFSQSGGSHGIGFAIPVNMVKIVIASAKSGSKAVKRPWFGARLQTVSSDLVEGLKLDRPTGALVASVVEKGPAADAGLKTGDVILAVDGVTIDDPDAFGFRFATKGLTGTAPLTVLRGGQRSTLQVRLAPAPETRPRQPIVIRGRWPLSGVTAMNMSPAVAEELAVDFAGDGVVIAEIADDSPAAGVGLRKGDIIVAVDGEKVENSRDLGRMGKDRQYYWKLTIQRGGEVITTIVGG
jgi:S1-C subfamily serine protease